MPLVIMGTQLRAFLKALNSIGTCYWRGLKGHPLFREMPVCSLSDGYTPDRCRISCLVKSYMYILATPTEIILWEDVSLVKSGVLFSYTKLRVAVRFINMFFFHTCIILRQLNSDGLLKNDESI